MRGFKPLHERQDAEGAGGPVRGPGTGTSDSIAKQIPEGTFIMPADSTARIGEQALASAGTGARGFKPRGKGVDVRLSSGEYQMPPQQVHAVGAQVLDAMKNATHTPVPEPRGFRPGAMADLEQPLFFANGGIVDDEQRRRANSFGDAAAAAASPGVTQIGAPPAPQAIAAPSPSNAFPGNRQPSPSPYVSAPAPATSMGGATGSWDAAKPPVAAPTAASAVSGANDAAQRFSGMPLTDAQKARVTANFEQDQRDSAAGAAAARAGGVFPLYGINSAPAPAPSAAGSGRGILNPPAAVSTSAQASPGAATAAEAPVASSNAPGLGFTTSAERVAQMNRDATASRAISDRSLELAQQGVGVPATPGLGIIGGADYANRNAAFNDGAALRTAAARGSWSPRRGFQSDQGAISAAAVPVQARAAADIDAGRQAAETQRAELGFRSAAARTAAENQRAADTNAIRREDVAGANRVRDTQVAAAQDEAALRRTLLDPQASVADRARAQQSLLALQGKAPGGEWGVQVTPTTKNADGSTTEGSVIRFNKQTGQAERVDLGQGGAPQALPPKDKLVKGQVYQTARGAARWDGSMFQPA